MLRYFLMMIFLLFSLCVWCTIQTNHPYTIMSNVAKNTFTRLRNEQKKIQENPDYLCTIVHEELLPYMQVKYSGSLILGQYYQKSTLLQRNVYFKIFQLYLEKMCAQVLRFYKNQSYLITLKEPLSRRAIFSTRITIFDKDSRPPVHIDFQWRKNSISGKWQAYDMIVDGISMINIKKNEWFPILRSKGIDGLIQQLRIMINKPITIK